MRGKGQGVNPAADVFGITPACAGKSGPCPDRGPPAEDHPRVCGEKHLYGAKFETKGTSPPRVRGKGRPGRLRVWLARITPAYAGKSSLACCPWRLHRDHPRVCGEKHRPSKTQSRPAGSPPRMRGKVVRLCMATGLRRITPAYAGKSSKQYQVNGIFQDHPRVCGEKLYSVLTPYPGKGSPPRMRGKVPFGSVTCLNHGITPAYAGKSLTIQKMTTRSRDHPRVCGEKGLALPLALPPQGSPPRMRGKGIF